MSEISKLKRDEIWILKGIAIISVACAHVAYDTSENRLQQMAIDLLNIMGTVGVILFLLISGFLYISQDEKAGAFWKKKLFRLVPAWLFCGTLVYLRCFQLYNIHHWSAWYAENIVCFSLKDYLKFILGYNSLYYFMPMLFCCFAVFRLVRKNDTLLVLITVFLLMLQLLGVGEEWFPTRYLNPFSWLGYFGIGCCYKRFIEEKWKDKINSNVDVRKVCLLILNLILLLIMSYQGIEMNYWNRFFVPFVMLQVVACCVCSNCIVGKIKVAKMSLVQLGKDSFYLYLLHMLLQSVPVKYLQGFGTVGILLRPIMLVVLTEILIIAIKILQKLIRGSFCKKSLD